MWTRASAWRVANEYIIDKIARGMPLSEAYRIFGLTPGASDEEIKRRYRELAREHHPDRPGGDLRKMQEINAAHDVLVGRDSRGRDTYSEPRREPVPEPRGRQRFRGDPEPGRFSQSDLNEWAQQVVEADLRQVLLRRKVPWPSFGDSIPSTNPWGSKARTFRVKEQDFTAEYVAQAVLSQAGNVQNIVDLRFEPRSVYGAWAIWEEGRSGFRSMNFEKVKAPKKKPKGVGMKPFEIDAFLRNNGMLALGGGSKYTYWGVASQRGNNEGVFLRSAQKTLRLVRRIRQDRKIVDAPLGEEVYFGSVTPALLQSWIERVTQRAASGD